MDTLDGKTNKHLANTDKQGGTHWTERLTNIDTKGGTHWTERLTIFWLPQTHRGDAQDGKTNTHTTL